MSTTQSGTHKASPQPGVHVAPPPTMVLFAQESGDTAPISVTDIHQGQIGDCFLLSAIGELALVDPAAISAMIQPLAGTQGSGAPGGETVTLHSTTGGGVFHAVTTTVANQFASNAANNGANQDVVGGQKEIWVQVLEKAYAQLHGGYAGISNGGSPLVALMALTGQGAMSQAPGDLTAAALRADMAAKDLIVLDTGRGREPFGLASNHAYMFEGLKTVGGVTDVVAGNPWGTVANTLVPVSQLGSAFVEADIGHLA